MNQTRRYFTTDLGFGYALHDPSPNLIEKIRNSTEQRGGSFEEVDRGTYYARYDVGPDTLLSIEGHSTQTNGNT